MTTPESPVLAVGSTLWVFDENRRVYPARPDGRQRLAAVPIWREHWRPRKITGETRVSWLLAAYDGDSHPQKISKRDLAAGMVRGVRRSERDLDAACFVNEHARKIGEQVQRLSGGEPEERVLREIAQLIGYVL